MAQEEQQIKFQYYSNDATKPNPLGYVEIDDFLNAIRNPKDKVKEILKKIQVEEDATKKANLKHICMDLLHRLRLRTAEPMII